MELVFRGAPAPSAPLFDARRDDHREGHNRRYESDAKRDQLDCVRVIGCHKWCGLFLINSIMARRLRPDSQGLQRTNSSGSSGHRACLHEDYLVSTLQGGW